MRTSKVFTLNRTQNVRLPAEIRFPESVKEVTVRVRGNERIIAPAHSAWDSFFINGPEVTDDFMNERPEQVPTERESFDD